MGMIVFYSLRLHINPDNVATPMAAALGDLVTLALFAGLGSFMYVTLNSAVWCIVCSVSSSSLICNGF